MSTVSLLSILLATLISSASSYSATRRTVLQVTASESCRALLLWVLSPSSELSSHVVTARCVRPGTILAGMQAMRLLSRRQVLFLRCEAQILVGVICSTLWAYWAHDPTAVFEVLIGVVTAALTGLVSPPHGQACQPV